ncbi:hypothetical protein BUB20358_06774 [Burkholderia ubonensis]|nr:hypothetical protein BUB20358_06774 [Burkholderia ubonensis]
MPASASAFSSTRCCASPFGTVRPPARPSCATAPPRITPTTGSPAATASARRLSTTTPQPSPRTKPSASASNVRQRPLGDSIPPAHSSTSGSGVSCRLTPPATAMSQAPERSCSQASCTVTSDDEQAVSIVIAGPIRPNACAMRPDTMLFAEPVPT